MVHHQPICISDRFSPLSDTPAEEKTLKLGSSIIRNMALETPWSKILQGPDIESDLNLLPKHERKYSKILIHIGSNDTRLHQSTCLAACHPSNAGCLRGVQKTTWAT